MFRKFALIAVASVAVSTTAKADPVTFQPFGNSSTQISIDGFDPAPGNILNVGVIDAANAFVGAGYNPITGTNSNSAPGVFQFTAFGQASIASYLPAGGGVAQGLPAGTNLTAVFGSTERLIGFNGTIGGANAVATSVLDAGAVNYFQLFAGNTGTNNFTGQGFNNGTLILTGRLVGLTNPLVIASNNANAGALDQFGTNGYPNINTTGQSGNTGIVVDVESYDPNYFVLGSNQTFDNFVVSTQFNTPFNAVDPSSAFLVNSTNTALLAAVTTAGAGLGAGGTGATAIGGLNGGPPAQNGPGAIQVQGDGNFNLSVTTTPNQIPEPATLAVFAAVMGAGGLVYRRKAKVVA